MGLELVGPAPTVPADILTLGSADARYARPVDRGLWAQSTAYALGDVVTFNALRYMCGVPHTSGSSFTGAAPTWVALALPPPRVSVWRSTTMTLANSSDTLVVWDQADYDVNYGTAQWSSAGLIIQVSGLYLVEGTFIFDGNSTGRRAIKLTKNTTNNAGTFASTITNANSWDNVLSTSRQVRLNAGDIIRMLVTQDKGSAMNSVVLKWNDVRPRIVASYLAPL